MRKPAQRTRPATPLPAPLDDASAVGHLVIDPLGVILRADDAAATILGASAGAALGRPLRYYVAPSHTDRLRAHLVTCTHGAAACRLQLRRPPLEVAREVLLSCRPGPGATHDAVLVAIAALSRPVEAPAEDRQAIAPLARSEPGEAARELISAQERERQRIARELHDQLGQHLIALTVGMKQLERVVEGTPRAERVLATLRDACDVLGQDIHRVALELRPSALDHLGLGPAVLSYAEFAARRAHLAIDTQCTLPHGFALDPFTEITVYRIVQEAITNIVKHARARHACVIIGTQDEFLRVVIEDDGAGFVANAPSHRLGLRGMHERAALVGGTLQIESRRGSGTTLFLRVPVKGREEGA